MIKLPVKVHSNMPWVLVDADGNKIFYMVQSPLEKEILVWLISLINKGIV